MEIRFYENVEDSLLQFAVIIAVYQGNYIFCKHRERTTLEIPGGHREPGEHIGETARRELQEETGAIRFAIRPVCVYSVVRQETDGESESFGMLYYAEVETLDSKLHSEIEHTVLIAPDYYTLESIDWTYPEIQPELLHEAQKRGF